MDFLKQEPTPYLKAESWEWLRRINFLRIKNVFQGKTNPNSLEIKTNFSNWQVLHFKNQFKMKKKDPNIKYIDLIYKVGFDKAFADLKFEWEAKKKDKPSDLDYIVDDWIKDLNDSLQMANGKNEIYQSLGQSKFIGIYINIKVSAIDEELTFESVLVIDEDPMKRLLTHTHNLSDCDFWNYIGEFYMRSSGSIDVLQLLKLIFSSKRQNKDCLMTLEEKQYLDLLPEEIEIHRGMSVTESKNKNYGMSWSLSKKIAEFFAYEYYQTIASGKPMTVVTIKIPKNEAIAYFNRRDEDEILWVATK
jgi:hypothetical protein